MGVIYIVSVEKGTGKTALCAALTQVAHNSGKTVGYLKPHVLPGDDADRDAAFMKHFLSGMETADMPQNARGRDVVFVEAMLGDTPQDLMSQTTYGAAREMQARVIAVEAWTGKESPYLDVYKGFGDALAGLVVNKVPKSQVSAAPGTIQEKLTDTGIELLGVIPEDRHLLAVTVGELAEKFNGEIISNVEKAGELVENFMIGALVVDSGAAYFSRKGRKAAIVRQDRPDMQLAALESPTACLILGGSRKKPLYNVLQKAEQRRVPVIVTDTPVRDIAAGIDDLLLAARFHQEPKASGLAELVTKNIQTNVVVQER